ncbi:MAG TPA: hypothetical protein VFM14_10825 [Gemmatimonadales bacterium]|nr:hypothetical protein [Gemmatimonadales bacterium]
MIPPGQATPASRRAQRVRQILAVLAAGIAATAAVFGGSVLTSGDSSASEATPRVLAIRSTLERAGLRAALDSLEAAAASDSSFLRDAHQLSHDLGRRAFMTGEDEGVIRECRPAFASGCYHGVVEAFVNASGEVSMPKQERMCASAGTDQRPGAVSECVHGLGHGVLGALSLDLQRTLRYCDQLSTPARRHWCHSGAFMEAVIAAQGNDSRRAGHESHSHGMHAGAGHAEHRLAIDPANPFSPCDAFADPHATACWAYQGYVILQRTNFDTPAAFAVCDTAPEALAIRCYKSIGLQITGLFQRDDAWVIEQCGLGRAPLAQACAGGAASARAGMDWSGDRAMRFCAATPSTWQATCYWSAGRVLASLATPTELDRLCANLDPVYTQACRDGVKDGQSAG